ncbi:unnamed protein product [Spodoptera exigua]|nr:unnamed protein product [Spodoptera exigua]
MAASGLDAKRRSGKDDHKHLHALVNYAFALKDALAGITVHSFELKAGISCGPLVGGVIGARKPVYDIWGNTVNEASRMESTGEAGKIQVTAHTRELLKTEYILTCRGDVQVKGKGIMETWWVTDPFCGIVMNSNKMISSSDDLYIRPPLPAPEREDIEEPGQAKSFDIPMKKKRRMVIITKRYSKRDDPSRNNDRRRIKCLVEKEEPGPSVHPFAELLFSMQQTRMQINTHPIYTWRYRRLGHPGLENGYCSTNDGPLKAGL